VAQHLALPAGLDRIRGVSRVAAQWPLRVALSARASTRDQDPELQLQSMREDGTARGWQPTSSLSRRPRRSVAGLTRMTITPGYACGRGPPALEAEIAARSARGQRVRTAHPQPECLAHRHVLRTQIPHEGPRPLGFVELEDAALGVVDPPVAGVAVTRH